MSSNSDLPLVSVVIPVHNPGGYLAPALQSVQNQTYTNFELIVIDDGSTENIEAICSGIPSLKLVRQPQFGQAISRNQGVINSTGEYIAFLDQDDLWYPSKLQKQIELMSQDPDIALCHTNYEIIDENGQFVRQARDPSLADHLVGAEFTIFGSGAPSYTAVAELGIPSCTVAMVRRQCIAFSGSFDPLLSICEDHDLWFRLCRRFKSAYVRSIEASYRSHPHQYTRNLKSAYKSDEQVWGNYIQTGRQTNDRGLAEAAQHMLKKSRRNYAAIAYDRARDGFKARDVSCVLRELKEALYLDPGFTLESFGSFLSSRLG